VWSEVHCRQPMPYGLTFHYPWLLGKHYGVYQTNTVEALIYPENRKEIQYINVQFIKLLQVVLKKDLKQNKIWREWLSIHFLWASTAILSVIHDLRVLYLHFSSAFVYIDNRDFLRENGEVGLVLHSQKLGAICISKMATQRRLHFSYELYRRYHS
jgi:hypothetical protein